MRCLNASALLLGVYVAAIHASVGAQSSWCGSSGSVQRPCAGRPERLVEWVAPTLPPIQHPSRPILADWDSDGYVDVLVVLPYRGTGWETQIRYFRQTNGSFVEQVGSENPFRNIDVGGLSAAVADWDGDGDQDLIVGTDDGQMHYYEQIANGSLKHRRDVFDFISVGWDAAPCPVDWDGDGDVDLILGARGQLLYYERLDNGSLAERSGEASPIPFLSVMNYLSNVPTAVDWDGDGDLDLILAYQPSSLSPAGRPPKLLERSESGALVMRTGDADPFSGSAFLEVCSLSAGDLDNDGDVDLLAGAWNFDSIVDSDLSDDWGEPPHFFRRDFVQDVWARRDAQLVQASQALIKNRRPHAVDWDGDGDLDIVLSAFTEEDRRADRVVLLHRDNVTGTIIAAPQNPFEPYFGQFENFSTFLATDWDFDGDVDLIATLPLDTEVIFPDCRVVLVFFERVMFPFDVLVERTGAGNPFDGIVLDRCEADPLAVDWDGDGDNDLIVGFVGGGLAYFEQLPDGSLRDRTEFSEFAGLPDGNQLKPFAMDWNRDGRMDFVYSDNLGRIRYFQRQEVLLPNGSRVLTLDKQLGKSNPFHNLSFSFVTAPCVVDWDKDGDYDLFVGNVERLFYYEQGFCNGGNSCFGGVCTKGDTCTCLEGGSLSDCSGCMAGRYAEKLFQHPTDEEPVRCELCAGEGTCHGRGVCADRAYEQTNAATVSLRLAARGSGSCICSEGFRGMDALGRVDCNEGVCPAGMELSNLTCWPCQPGHGKADPGLHACETCPPGTFSDGATGLCEACPLGTIALAPGAVACKQCPAGQFRGNDSDVCAYCWPGTSAAGAGSSECEVCQAGFFASAFGSTVCEQCGGVFLVADASRSECIMSATPVVAAMGFLAGVLVYAVASRVKIVRKNARVGSERRCWKIVGRSFHIEDIRREESEGPDGLCAPTGRLIMELTEHHNLRKRWRGSYLFELTGTGHPELDRRRFFRARGLYGRPRELELLDESKQPLDVDWNSSMGTARLSATSMLVLHGSPPVFVTIAVCALSLFGMMVWVQFRAAPASWPGYAVGAGMVLLACAAVAWKGLRPTVGRLDKALARYSAQLHASFPAPKATERGPERAIKVGQVLDLFEFFAAFIRNRNMYYVEPNIIRRLTHRSRLSFAEVAGPSRAQWFVSHFWGTPLRYTCDALEKHARAYSVGGASWRDMAYWICTFSNNQYQVEAEVGATWSESSFYLTLKSGCCRGTCMVLDAKAMPLTRSWCLFELLQTFLLAEKSHAGVGEFADFQGLLLCANTGVLNNGQASVEISMGIARRLAGLKLEDAQASVQADKEMIDKLVIDEMGSFQEINSKLLLNLEAALTAAQQATDSQFKALFETVAFARGNTASTSKGSLRSSLSSLPQSSDELDCERAIKAEG